MEPLLIYVSMLAFCLVVGSLVWYFRSPPTRQCPLCDARVALGKQRCQGCGYRFSLARYY